MKLELVDIIKRVVDGGRPIYLSAFDWNSPISLNTQNGPQKICKEGSSEKKEANSTKGVQMSIL